MMNYWPQERKPSERRGKEGQREAKSERDFSSFTTLAVQRGGNS